MVKEIKSYICEVCGEEYSQKNVARGCEKSGVEVSIEIPAVFQIPSDSEDCFLLLNHKKIVKSPDCKGKHNWNYAGAYMEGINATLELPSRGFTSSQIYDASYIILEKIRDSWEISGDINAIGARLLSQEEITNIRSFNKDLEMLIESY